MKGSGFSVQSSAALVAKDRQKLMEGVAYGGQWSQEVAGYWDSGVGHLLVGEYASDATISGGKHGQKAVPGGSRKVRSQACLL